MTKEELRELYLAERNNLSQVELMIAAYNRALEDAIDAVFEGHIEDKVEIESLKIK